MLGIVDLLFIELFMFYYLVESKFSFVLLRFQTHLPHSDFGCFFSATKDVRHKKTKVKFGNER